jgi:uncharacterized protein YqhQ
LYDRAGQVEKGMDGSEAVNAARGGGDTVGGMALCEGVLMRAGDRWAMAVRRPGGSIALRTGESAGPKWHWRSVPLVRGVLALADAFTLGVRGMAWSVEQSRRDGDASSPPVRLAPTIAAALALVIGVFFLVPAWLAARLVGSHNGFVFGAAEGTVRLSFLLAYLYAIGCLPEVRRLFGYHGAEHMVVATHEARLPLTVDNARRFDTLHARCGTTFLLVVMVLAVLVHGLAGSPSSLLGVVVTHVALLPFIAAIAFEFLRAASRRPNALLAVAMSLQHLTTRVPDDGQLEVAIAALNATAPALEAPAHRPAVALTAAVATG